LARYCHGANRVVIRHENRPAMLETPILIAIGVLVMIAILWWLY
jgi:hypothetical protein